MTQEYLDHVKEETYAQILRLKTQWGYGRWSRPVAEAIATTAAIDAVAIAEKHPLYKRSVGEEEIPKILHRIWVGGAPLPRRYEEWWEDFKELNPGWTFVTHLDASALLEDDVIAACKAPAQLADILRLAVLEQYGGVYVDCDTRPLKSLDSLLVTDAFAGYEHGTGLGKRTVVPNAILGAVAHHPAISASVDLAISRLPGPVWWAGPGATSVMLQHREDVTLMPPDAFYPVHWKGEWLPKAEAVTAENHPGTFVVSYYGTSWNENKRTEL